MGPARVCPVCIVYATAGEYALFAVFMPTPVDLTDRLMTARLGENT